MWAEQYNRLEPQHLFSAQWQYYSLERGWQIFFGGVFDKRAGMLIAARRNEDGNVHRRDRVSKTMTKNIRFGFFFNNPKTKEGPKEAPFGGSTITADTAERSFPLLMMKGMSCFLSVFIPRLAPLTLKHVFRPSQMKKISSFTFGELSRLKQASSVQPDDLKNCSSCPEYQPERLKEYPFPPLDDDPLMPHHADAFNKLTAFAIGLTHPSIPKPDEGVKTPSAADVRTTCFDIQLLADLAKLLATFGHLVDLDVFSIKNFNLLITSSFYSKRVDKNDADGKIIFPDYQVLTDIGDSDHRKGSADLTRRVGFRPPRLFLLSPQQPQHRPPTTPTPCGIRTPNQTAARHPLGLLWVRRFGSIFFTPMTYRVGGVGLSKCKGKLNTFENIISIVNLPLLLLAWGGQRVLKNVSCPEP